MGGGSAHFLPKGTPRRAAARTTIDYVAKFRDAGYAVAATGAEMTAAAATAGTSELLGLFHTGNMDGVLDRKFLKGGTVKKFPDQPDLTEQVSAALEVLSRKPAGLLPDGRVRPDRQIHPCARHGARGLRHHHARQCGQARPRLGRGRGDDTLILVLADHNHPISLIGTIDDDMATTPNVPLRDRVGTYDKARFPNYPKADKDGYPPRVDVSRRLAIFSASSPDYYETFRPKLDDPNAPTVPGKQPRTFEANERYRTMPGAMLRLGNLPKYLNASVHSGEDVILTATGPGSERVHGQLDNTEVFRVMAEALGLGHGE